jgi:hypothetical protein
MNEENVNKMSIQIHLLMVLLVSSWTLTSKPDLETRETRYFLFSSEGIQMLWRFILLVVQSIAEYRTNSEQEKKKFSYFFLYFFQD